MAGLNSGIFNSSIIECMCSVCSHSFCTNSLFYMFNFHRLKRRRTFPMMHLVPSSAACTCRSRICPNFARARWRGWGSGKRRWMLGKRTNMPPKRPEWGAEGHLTRRCCSTQRRTAHVTQNQCLSCCSFLFLTSQHVENHFVLQFKCRNSTSVLTVGRP